jgi:hypothetical protein
MRDILLVVSLVFMVVGCGGGGGSDENATTPTPPTEELTVNMEIGTIYQVHSGDRIRKDSNSSKIEVIYYDIEKITTVELLEGNSSIIIKQREYID